MNLDSYLLLQINELIFYPNKPMYHVKQIAVPSMNRRDLVLAVLAASDGRPYTPVQIQKALFLISQNAGDVVDEGPGFDFQPYDYGPFDSAVYAEAERLAANGAAEIVPSRTGSWSTYAASDEGVTWGREILDELSEDSRDYIQGVSAWVRRLSFGSLVKSIYDAYPEMKARSVFRG